jgi:hypothetical protein
MNDQQKAECPYCHRGLSKMPSRKTKCPHCGEFMFVRTRPKDRAKVVVTREEAARIEEDWAIVSGTNDHFIADKNEIDNERALLRIKFGKEPSENDVKWALLNKSLIEHAQLRNWGLYRNTKFIMAEILRNEMKLEQAFHMYLEVCYLDLNGPNNTGGIDDPEVLEQYPPFDPTRHAFLAPGVVKIVQLVICRLAIGNDKIKSLFVEHNSQIAKSLSLPLSTEDAWPLLEREL